MIDAFNITKYDRTDAELECFLLFAIAVAGKSAATTDKAFDRLWLHLRNRGLCLLGAMPFNAIKSAIELGFLSPQSLRDCGFGCYNHRFKSFQAAANSGLNLRTCSVEDLEKIPGIGRKTSRFFVLHSRPGARVAALDTHVLKYLQDTGTSWRDVPKSTPSSAKEYARLEQDFLVEFDHQQQYRQRNNLPLETLAEFDLAIWKAYTRSKAA